MGTKTTACFIVAAIWCLFSIGGSCLYFVDGFPAFGLISMVVWLIVSAIVFCLYNRERSKGPKEFNGRFRRRDGALHFDSGIHKGKSIGWVQRYAPDYLEHLATSDPDPDVRYLIWNTIGRGRSVPPPVEPHQSPGE